MEDLYRSIFAIYWICWNIHGHVDFHLIFINIVIVDWKLRDVVSAIDVPDGFLHEWWCIFYDFAAQLKHQESNTETSSEVILCLLEVLLFCFVTVRMWILWVLFLISRLHI